ncbi:MAG: hypothetical protein PHQ23_01560 [Candidatus Wallbacteria bacterium]|nr:hypothetical protein [Candidatus Wallbacteria bacterium]
MDKQNISIVDFDLPFPRIVFLMVKFAVAAVPAVIIIALAFFSFWMFMYNLTAGTRAENGFSTTLFSSGVHYSQGARLQNQINELGGKIEAVLSRTMLEKTKNELEKVRTEISRLRKMVTDYETSSASYTSGMLAVSRITTGEPSVFWAASGSGLGKSPVITVKVVNFSGSAISRLFIEGTAAAMNKPSSLASENFDFTVIPPLPDGVSREISLTLPDGSRWKELLQGEKASVSMNFQIRNAVAENGRPLVDYTMKWTESPLEKWIYEANRDRLSDLTEHAIALEHSLKEAETVHSPEHSGPQSALLDELMEDAEIKGLIEKKDLSSLFENQRIKELLKDRKSSGELLNALSGRIADQ